LVLAIHVAASEAERLLAGEAKCVLQPVDDFSANTRRLFAGRSPIHVKSTVSAGRVTLMPELIVAMTEKK